MKHLRFIMIMAVCLAFTPQTEARDNIASSSARTGLPFRITHRADGTYAIRTTQMMQHSASSTVPSTKPAGIHQKIADQRAKLERMNDAVNRTQQSSAPRKKARAVQPEPLMLYGIPPAFYKGTSFTAPPGAEQLQRSASANVLVNGKTRDTVSVGDPFTLTWSFAPNQIAAVLNIYIDCDSNGIVSAKDIPWITNALAYDNTTDDNDPAVGAFKAEAVKGNGISIILSSLIFEVYDYQSVSTAVLTVQRRPSAAVVTGSVSPSRPGLMLYVDRSPDAGVYCLTDSAGRFTVPVDRTLTNAVSIRPEYQYGMISGCIPPVQNLISLTSDTTVIPLNYHSASEFIEGYVKDQYGSGIGDVWVEAHTSADVNLYARTDETGFYRIGCTPGVWYLYSRVERTNDYLPISMSSSIIVPPGATTRKDFVFSKSDETISGRVTMNGIGLAGLQIFVSSDQYSNLATTQADGRYSVPVMQAAGGIQRYDVQIRIPMGYYAMISAYPDIQPGAANIDFAVLKPSGGVEGKVTDESTGKPIRDAEITFSGQSYRSTSTNDSGWYRISLPDGIYSLYAEAPAYGQYKENGIAIGGGVITKDIRLHHAASYSGTVTDEYGKPIEYALVTTVDSAGNIAASVAFTDRDGRYEVKPYTAGRYFAYAQADGYARQWYKNADNMAAAVAFQIADGNETPGIDFLLSRGGSIAGRVHDPSGKPLANVSVVAFDSLYNGTLFSRTDDSGAYVIIGVAEGYYHVIASDPQELYCEQYYNGTALSDSAALIHVGAKQTVDNIDFTLHMGGFISGSVRDAKNNALSYASIDVFDSTKTNTVGYASSDESGEYHVSPLEPYRRCYVRARKWMDGFSIEQWFDHATGAESAAPIVPVPGELRKNVDFTIPTGGAIAGKVFYPPGSVFTYVSVIVEDTSGAHSYGVGVNPQGDYLIENVPSGSYYVCARPFSDYKDQWYNRKSSRLTADPVGVNEGATTGDINFYLEPLPVNTDSLEVRIRLADIPDTLAFNPAHAPDSCADYWWGVRFDADNDPATGPNGCEIELALVHSKDASQPECRSTLINGTSHLLLEWSGNEVYNLRFDVPVRIDSADRNTIVMRVPKAWPELSGITSGSKYYFHTLYASPTGAVEDTTAVTTQMSGLTDPAGDVAYGFVDIVSGRFDLIITGIAPETEIPMDYRLDQNYPNPFNPSTTIRYALPASRHVRLAVYDVLGREVAVLVNEVQGAGWKDVVWNASTVSSGVYFYRLTAGSFVQTNRMLVVK